jgi:protein TonB
VRACQVLQSSGSPILDQRTCQLYERRYRYLPARDSSGRPVEITIRAIRSWSLRH